MRARVQSKSWGRNFIKIDIKIVIDSGHDTLSLADARTAGNRCLVDSINQGFTLFGVNPFLNFSQEKRAFR
jgi:hypothetical protein